MNQFQMKQMSKDEMKNLLYVSIISADNNYYTEDAKQEVISRQKKEETKGKGIDWRYVLEPVDKNGRLAELFEYTESVSDETESEGED